MIDDIAWVTWCLCLRYGNPWTRLRRIPDNHPIPTSRPQPDVQRGSSVDARDEEETRLAPRDDDEPKVVSGNPRNLVLLCACFEYFSILSDIDVAVVLTFWTRSLNSSANSRNGRRKGRERKLRDETASKRGYKKWLRRWKRWGTKASRCIVYLRGFFFVMI